MPLRFRMILPWPPLLIHASLLWKKAAHFFSLLWKNWRLFPLQSSPLLLGLPQHKWLLPSRVCKEVPWVRGTSPSSLMGTPPVPTEFPTSLASVSTSHNPISRDSCGTPDFFAPILSDLSNTQLYPSHLPFGDNLPPVKTDSSFQISFCNIGGFLALGLTIPRSLKSRPFWLLTILIYLVAAKQTLTGMAFPITYSLRNGSAQLMAGELLQLITLMKILVNTSFAAHSGSLPDMLLSIFPLAKKIPPTWVAGSPVLFCVGPANVCTLSLHTVPVPTPHPDCAVSMLNIAGILCNSLTIHPWQAFLDDLGIFIMQWCSVGGAILLLADMNGDICHLTLQEFMWTHELHKLILSCFPSLPIPATFQCSGHSGYAHWWGLGHWWYLHWCYLLLGYFFKPRQSPCNCFRLEPPWLHQWTLV